ncbi:hypothetical protein GLOTRDRAFT_95679 [Gloeophyllum trabeum ATCC 11539]|uniref:Uncharacterized protein n=1 Tax=Gloeophyllum trabeum (strain ATCC 11539 / FP-39264 / Madison 617) TaxID=670483 RepID=S7RJP9_GLOTA|nr:uncharacterized protein GLOTRDRAFT_95679 [Gloeophyllum trabeum ATCC 11539]EPQ52864.1 hypothetical protein GLOTRDRAFT_95679 [Gloeophyllum trabeum ATCC 11539]
MVKWQSEQELTRDMLVYDKMWPVFMGIYICTFGTNQDIGRCDIRYHLLTVWLGRDSLRHRVRFPKPRNTHTSLGQSKNLEQQAPGSGNSYAASIESVGRPSIRKGTGAVRFFMTAFNPRQGCLVSDPHGAQIILVYATSLTRGGSELRIWRLGDLGRILFAQGMLYFVVTSVVNAFSVVSYHYLGAESFLRLLREVALVVSLMPLRDIPIRDVHKISGRPLRRDDRGQRRLFTWDQVLLGDGPSAV